LLLTISICWAVIWNIGFQLSIPSSFRGETDNFVIDYQQQQKEKMRFPLHHLHHQSQEHFDSSCNSSGSFNYTRSHYMSMPFHYFLKGPGLEKSDYSNPLLSISQSSLISSSASSSSWSFPVICNILGGYNINHFPHVMQHLIACISWWQSIGALIPSPPKNKKNPNNNANFHAVLRLSDDSNDWLHRTEYITSLLSYLKHEFQSQFSIDIVPNDTKLEDYKSLKQHGVNYKHNAKESGWGRESMAFHAQSVHHIQTFRDHMLQAIKTRKRQQLDSQSAQRNNKNKIIHDDDDDDAVDAPVKCMTKMTLKNLFTGHSISHREPSRLPTVAFLNRHIFRQVINGEDVTLALQSALSTKHDEYSNGNETTAAAIVTYIPSLDNYTFEEQLELFASIDILVSPHGAQLTSIPFLRKNGTVIEIYPAFYHIPGYFGSLAAVSGIVHGYIDLLPSHDRKVKYPGDGTYVDPVVETEKGQEPGHPGLWFAQRDMICAPVDVIVQAVKLEVQAWKDRICGEGEVT
jgi:hypothetical protein